MKKILYILTATFGVLLFACSPMQDINDELESTYDAANTKAQYLIDKQVAPAAYTLTDEDYTLSSNSSVSNYKNFSVSDLPKDYLPEILNAKFSGENAQSMMVTYNFYSKPVVDKANARVIASDEYNQMGQNYSNFSDAAMAQSLIAKMFDREVYATEAGAEKTAKYVLYSTNQTRYVQVSVDFTAEEVSYTSSAIAVTDAQYLSMGNTYKNFDDIAQALTRLATLAETEGTAPNYLFM